MNIMLANTNNANNIGLKNASIVISSFLYQKLNPKQYVSQPSRHSHTKKCWFIMRTLLTLRTHTIAIPTGITHKNHNITSIFIKHTTTYLECHNKHQSLLATNSFSSDYFFLYSN
jgi:hypothetical protein